MPLFYGFKKFSLVGREKTYFTGQDVLSAVSIMTTL